VKEQKKEEAAAKAAEKAERAMQLVGEAKR